jgi:diacylglycerol kinase (ATP)
MSDELKMEASMAFTFSGRIRSVKHAVDGIWLVLRSQHNAWVHLFASIAVIISGIIYQISPSHWTLIITAIVLVWISEALNTAFEFLCDAASPNFHPLVKRQRMYPQGRCLSVP